MGPASQGIYTMPDSKVTDLSDLAGKTIAINAPKNIPYLLAASVLAEHGIKPSLVRFASVPFPKMTAVQPRPGRQRGQDTAPARSERDAAVHRVPQVQHRHHAPHLS
jgi:ABC-type nitrate/sulfonate/bicarbonate transport system substrate-binding protein